MKRDMTSGNVTVSLLYFVIPLTVGNLLQQLYSVVDTYIVGRYVGGMALSAVGSVSNLIFIFNIAIRIIFCTRNEDLKLVGVRIY